MATHVNGRREAVNFLLFLFVLRIFYWGEIFFSIEYEQENVRRVF